MALQRRQYVGNVPTNATLNGSINNSVASFILSSGTGFPDGSVGPFVVTIDQGNASEEKVLCTSRSGNAVTVTTRGFDGTTATSHANGASVLHTISAVDMDEANQAVANTIGKVTTLGDLLVGAGANVMKRLGIGSANQLLRTNAGGTDLEFATPTVAGNLAGSLLAPTFSAAGNAAILAAVKPSVATVAMSEATSSATFVDLATVGPSVTVTINATGLALVILTCGITSSAGEGVAAFVGSGANTIAANANDNSIVAQSTGTFRNSGLFWLSSLSAGSTTLKMQYASTGTSNFFDRTIMVIPF